MSLYENKDPWILQAINEIKSNFGHDVSVDAKSKSLEKFGENESVPTTGANIQEMPSGIVEETYVNTNGITYVVSDSALDTMAVKMYEGHTTDGTDWTFFKNETEFSLNGTTPVALPVAVSRLTRARIESYANGNIYFYEGGAVTGGTPNDLTTVHTMITAGDTQTNKASTTVSSSDYWIITNYYGSVNEKTSAYADIQIQVKKCTDSSDSWHPLCGEFSASSNSGAKKFEKKPYLIVQPNHDVRLWSSSSGASVYVSGGIGGVLASII